MQARAGGGGALARTRPSPAAAAGAGVPDQTAPATYCSAGSPRTSTSSILPRTTSRPERCGERLTRSSAPTCAQAPALVSARRRRCL